VALAMIRRLSVLGVGLLVLGAGVPSAHALSDIQVKCVKAIAKAGKSYVKSVLKTKQKCRNANLKETGSCPVEDTTALGKALDKLYSTIEKSCAFDGNAGKQAANLGDMGFPGPCNDKTGGNFLLGDLQNCIKESHDAIIAEFLPLEYDSDVTGPLDADRLKCQKTVAKESAKHVDCVLNAVQKCRIGILTGKIQGVLADNCIPDDPKTNEAHEKCIAKLESAITGKCTDTQTTNLQLCAPDDGSIANTAQAAHCEHEEHMVRTDGPAKDVPADLIDYEFATRGGACGDGVVNSLDEECDGTCPGGTCNNGTHRCVGGDDDGKLCDDSACPGQCGTATDPNGFFACLCKTPPAGATWEHRLRIVDHVNADFDEGWTGLTHDQKYVEGGGFLVDLYDCDANGDCIVGPHCSGDHHQPCAAPSGSYASGNSICAALGKGTCIKPRTATGPHCYLDPTKECDPALRPNDNVHCGTPGDFCVKSFRSPPLPLSAQNTSVCVINVYAEDIVGTTNILTGSTSVRLREKSITYLSLGTAASTPCPVCGGFCLNSKERCVDNDGCPGSTGPCVTDLVCSDGPNEGKPCRTTPPFGGPTPLFGTTSIDCWPGGSDITSGGLDILFNPYTTGFSSMVPTIPCGAEGFQGNACLGGDNEGRPCTALSECPSGSCSPQCFCPQLGGAVLQKPNGCWAACVGGSNDPAPCAEDSECPGGFCHKADCRVDSLDPDSIQEGKCTVGPVESYCSTTTFWSCASNDDCKYPNCSFCGSGETCVPKFRECFVNSGITRQGTVGMPEGANTAVHCIPPTSASSVNNVTGLPGPGTIVQPAMSIVVP